MKQCNICDLFTALCLIIQKIVTPVEKKIVAYRTCLIFLYNAKNTRIYCDVGVRLHTFPEI